MSKKLMPSSRARAMNGRLSSSPSVQGCGAALRHAVAHAAEAEARHLEAGLAEVHIFHFFPPDGNRPAENGRPVFHLLLPRRRLVDDGTLEQLDPSDDIRTVAPWRFTIGDQTCRVCEVPTVSNVSERIVATRPPRPLAPRPCLGFRGRDYDRAADHVFPHDARWMESPRGSAGQLFRHLACSAWWPVISEARRRANAGQPVRRGPRTATTGGAGGSSPRASRSDWCSASSRRRSTSRGEVGSSCRTSS